MARNRARWIAATVGILVVMSTLTASMALGGGVDRTGPTTPTNLRVLGVGPYSVSLAWDASKDKSGIGSYHVCCSNVSSQTFPGNVTNATYTAGLQPGTTHTLRVYARDTLGNWSKASNSVTVTTTRDTTVPAKPVLALIDLGTSWASLAWSGTDNDPTLRFEVFLDGQQIRSGPETSGTFPGLAAESTYTFTVRARDDGGNVSPLSDPVTVTTEPVDATDVTPPSAPGNLRTNGMAFPDGETWLFWDQSVDAVTPQFAITYLVYLNGVLDHGVVGYGQTILYGTPFSRNTYTVIAVDEAGNESTPATILVDNL
jgi:chitodextrinase